MAITFVKRSEIPVSGKGKEGTLSVMIGGNGQITLSTKATKALNGASEVAMGFDNGKVVLALPSPKLKKIVADKDWIQLRKPKKGGTVSFSASGLLRATQVFGDHIYDFKASGNQTFPVTVDEKQGFLLFDLPKGKVTPRPVVPRKKKEGPAVKANGSTPAASGVTNAPAVEEELTLEPA